MNTQEILIQKKHALPGPVVLDTGALLFDLVTLVELAKQAERLLIWNWLGVHKRVTGTDVRINWVNAHQASLRKLRHHGQGRMPRDGVVSDGAVIVEGHVDLMTAQGASLARMGRFRSSRILCAKIPAGHGLLIVCHLVAVLIQWGSPGCMC